MPSVFPPRGQRWHLFCCLVCDRQKHRNHTHGPLGTQAACLRPCPLWACGRAALVPHTAAAGGGRRHDRNRKKRLWAGKVSGGEGGVARVLASRACVRVPPRGHCCGKERGPCVHLRACHAAMCWGGRSRSAAWLWPAVSGPWAPSRQSGWCPSIACMKGPQRDGGRLLIESVDERQMALGHRQSVEQTGSYSRTGPAQSRLPSPVWPMPRRELPSAKVRLAMV
jgi:hypothetical protein